MQADRGHANEGTVMRPVRWTSALLLVLAGALPALTADKGKSDDGFVPMFNGKDLAGWVNVNCAPSTFYVKDGEVVTTGKPTGYLRTARQYENFIAEFDWMHVPPAPGEVGNSGFFVWADPVPAVGTGYTRGIEVQVLVNLTYRNKKGEVTATSQGDLFSIWGATCVPDRPHPEGWARCLPSANHARGEREWNHYRVEANDGRITLAVNGHVVSGVSRCRPRKGYLALESEGSECHFKNLRIKELPSTGPRPDEVADMDPGFRSLYTGLDLSGWRADGRAGEHWQPRDTVLRHEGQRGARGDSLRTEREFGDAEYLVDFRFPEGGADACSFGLRAGKKRSVRVTCSRGGEVRVEEGPSDGSSGDGNQVAPRGDAPPAAGSLKPAGQWNRLRVRLRETNEGRDAALAVTLNGKTTDYGPDLGRSPTRGPFVLRADGAMEFANLFVHELK
jgi:hypothetical protein